MSPQSGHALYPSLINNLRAVSTSRMKSGALLFLERFQTRLRLGSSGQSGLGVPTSENGYVSLFQMKFRNNRI